MATLYKLLLNSFHGRLMTITIHEQRVWLADESKSYVRTCQPRDLVHLRYITRRHIGLNPDWVLNKVWNRDCVRAREAYLLSGRPECQWLTRFPWNNKLASERFARTRSTERFIFRSGHENKWNIWLCVCVVKRLDYDWIIKHVF